MGIKDMFEKYSGGSSTFFSLKNDGDTALVRFLYRGEDDLQKDLVVVHEVDIDNSKRKVECLQPKGQDCPLCDAKIPNRARLFLQLIDYEDGEQLKVWERGKRFVPEILGYIMSFEPIYTTVAQVTRYGKKGDTQTSYKLNGLPNDERSIKDTEESAQKFFEMKTDVKGSNNMVISRPYEDLKEIANGTFTLKNETGNKNPISQNKNSTSPTTASTNKSNDPKSVF